MVAYWLSHSRTTVTLHVSVKNTALLVTHMVKKIAILSFIKEEKN